MADKPSAEILVGKNIVVIDDDLNSLDVATIVLEFAGATVSIAENGKEGLAQIRRVKPLLVLCDISMPVMDGWDFIKALREDNEHKALIAIALTAHAMVGDREKVLSAGFDGYLTKPLEPSKFVNQLMQILSNLSNKQALALSGTKE